MAGVSEPPKRRPMPPPPRGPPPVQPVDREKTCPLLLRVFTKMGSHHTKEDFAVRGKEPKDEVQIYTWKDATLRELTDLVKEVAPAARRRDVRLSFAFVYPDKNGRLWFERLVYPIFLCICSLKSKCFCSTLVPNFFPYTNSETNVYGLAYHQYQVGKTFSNRIGKLDDAKALAELGFQIGDYLDVAIL